MLTYRNDSKLGDRIIVIPPKGPYVQLPQAAHGVRYFPKENKTITPIFNSMKPNPGVKRNETPKIDNTYQNGYKNSRSILEESTSLSTVNNWFEPEINHTKEFKFIRK